MLESAAGSAPNPVCRYEEKTATNGRVVLPKKRFQFLFGTSEKMLESPARESRFLLHFPFAGTYKSPAIDYCVVHCLLAMHCRLLQVHNGAPPSLQQAHSASRQHLQSQNTQGLVARPQLYRRQEKYGGLLQG